MAASAVAASVAVPTAIAATLTLAAGTLDVLLPALGANAAARTRSVALFEAVRTLLVAVPEAALSITVAATAPGSGTRYRIEVGKKDRVKPGSMR